MGAQDLCLPDPSGELKLLENIRGLGGGAGGMAQQSRAPAALVEDPGARYTHGAHVYMQENTCTCKINVLKSSLRRIHS